MNNISLITFRLARDDSYLNSKSLHYIFCHSICCQDWKNCLVSIFMIGAIVLFHRWEFFFCSVFHIIYRINRRIEARTNVVYRFQGEYNACWRINRSSKNKPNRRTSSFFSFWIGRFLVAGVFFNILDLHWIEENYFSSHLISAFTYYFWHASTISTARRQIQKHSTES